jgi:hypothetical protein
MSEIKIEQDEIKRILELEQEVIELKILFADLDIQKLDAIENLKAKLTEKINYMNKLKKKYSFEAETFSLDVENNLIKF